MSELGVKKPRNASTLLEATLVLVIFAAVILLAGCGWHRAQFPYGRSHCCSKYLGTCLTIYAGDHKGWLPFGEKTPEASLSLLCSDDSTQTDIEIMRGKTVSLGVLKETFSQDGSLGPESCGWHYIEGLREDDDSSIAVVWDKASGLGHNGERRPDLAHEVVYLDGHTAFVTKDTWSQFLLDQRKKLEKVIASRQSDAPPIRWSDEVSLGPNRAAR